jgi:general secretion pathway protein J
MRPSRSAPRLSRGFTLVEVLVALFIMAVLSVMAWQGVDALVRTRDGAQDNTEATLRLGTVLAQWEQDLNQIQQSSAAPGLKFDGQSLRLTRRTPEGIQLVLWTRQENTWYRWASPSVTRIADLQEWWIRSQQWSAVGSEALRMLDGVSALQVYYYQMGDNNWSNAQSTGNVVAPPVAPPPANPGANPGGEEGEKPQVGGEQEALPLGVRLVLTLPRGTLTRDVLMRTSSS